MWQYIRLIRFEKKTNKKNLSGSPALQVGLTSPGLSHDALTEQLQLRCVKISNALLCVRESL